MPRKTYPDQPKSATNKRLLSLPLSVSKEKKDTMDKAKLEKVAHAIASHLHCPSCAKGLHRAFSLPCGHFICDLCMTAIERDASCEGTQSHGQCPECHKLFPNPPSSEWDFPSNPLVGQVLQHLTEQNDTAVRQSQRFFWKKSGRRTLGEEVPCGLCHMRRRAVKFCQTCELNYCKKCLKNLHTRGPYHSHVLLAPIMECCTPCPRHLERSMTHYCFSDGTGGCEECMEAEHQDHDVNTVDEAYCRRGRSLREALANAEKVRAVGG
ncbi:hypothetical protein J4Q44_G00268400 [Coregonus suidteri]|uniref:RING-type domain-containing protein n=1 Tax=Coregonus suidteri TaxID=861788 RepID=A0AAN8LB27_9TELE